MVGQNGLTRFTPVMKIFGVAGHSGMGKTTLLERLVPEIASLGLVVSLIKHSHKNIDIDRPGKDSYRLRESGCKVPQIPRLDLHDISALAAFVMANAVAR
jgi:molybdopterin-guanine dinucleotide biosynthesis protein